MGLLLVNCRVLHTEVTNHGLFRPNSRVDLCPHQACTPGVRMLECTKNMLILDLHYDVDGVIKSQRGSSLYLHPAFLALQSLSLSHTSLFLFSFVGLHTYCTTIWFWHQEKLCGTDSSSPFLRLIFVKRSRTASCIIC